jgi:Holliday junction resolvase RusA-like endonuclease
VASDALRFFAPGLPQPGGSKKGFVVNGRAVIVEDCKRSGSWKDRVAHFALRSGKFPAPLQGPLCVTFEFVMPRPKGHMGSGRNAAIVKASAPKYPTGKPDTTKLIRSSEDALKGICWGDDSQIVMQHGSKRYGNRPGVYITVQRMED